MAHNTIPPVFTANPSKSNVITHRTALFFRQVIDGGANSKYERLNYDKVFLGFRGQGENRNFFQLNLNSARLPAKRRAKEANDGGGTATTVKAEWVEGYDAIEFLDEASVAAFSRIGFANI